MQAGPLPPCQIDRERRRLPTRLFAANQRMQCDRDPVAMSLTVMLFVGPDGRRILTKGRNQGRSIAEDPLEYRGIIDQHVAGRGTHKYLDAASLIRPQSANLLDVVFVAPK